MTVWHCHLKFPPSRPCGRKREREIESQGERGGGREKERGWRGEREKSVRLVWGCKHCANSRPSTTGEPPFLRIDQIREANSQSSIPMPTGPARLSGGDILGAPSDKTPVLYCHTSESPEGFCKACVIAMRSAFPLFTESGKLSVSETTAPQLLGPAHTSPFITFNAYILFLS